MITYLTYTTHVKGKKVTIEEDTWEDPKDAIARLIEKDPLATDIKATTVNPHPTPIIQSPPCNCRNRRNPDLGPEVIYLH